MRLYSREILPRLCDFALNTARLAKYRRQLLTHAAGDILEIGFGTGLNLPHYPQAIRTITAVEPNPGMLRLAQGRIRRSEIAVYAHVLSGEHLPFHDGQFDCAVSTFTLCSFGNISQGLREIYRVIKPGGTFLFLEHGLSPDVSVQKWQRRLSGLQARLAGGCHLDRNMKALIGAQPFASLHVEEFYLPAALRTHGYIFLGKAQK